MKKNIYLILFFFIGLLANISQIILIREFLVIFYGNELIIGIIFFNWLISVALGSFIFKNIFNKINKSLNFYFILLLFLIIFIIIDIVLIRNLRNIVNIQSYSLFSLQSALIYTLIILLFPCSIIGFIFPFSVFIYHYFYKEKSLNFIYMSESLGSMSGGILFSFLLVKLLNPFQILLLCGLILLFLKYLIDIFNKKNIISFLINTFLLIIFLISLASSNRFNDLLINIRWKSFAKGINLIKNKDSEYQNISLGISNNQYNIYLNGHIFTSFPDPYTDASLIHQILLQHNNPEKILIIGFPTTNLINEAFHHRIDKIDFIEIDQEIIIITKEYNKIDFNNKINIIFNDALYYIKRTKEKYDVILLQISDPSTQLLNRFYTLEFYQEINKILKEDGIFITSLTGDANYIENELLAYNAITYNTLKKVFKYCYINPGNLFYYYCSQNNNSITLYPEILINRYEERKIISNYFDKNFFYELFDKNKIEKFNQVIENSEINIINTDKKPIIYFYNLFIWSKFSNSFLSSKLLIIFNEKVLFTLIISIFFFLFIIGIYKKNNVINIFTFIISFTTMTLELILLFSFQNLIGFIYSQIGILIGIFMFGLFLGGLFSILIKNINKRYLILFQILLFILIISTNIVQFTYLSNELYIYLLFSILFILIGLTLGFLFTSLCRIGKTNKNNFAKKIGIINFMDYLGASLGALLWSFCLLPILGIQLLCLLLILINIFSMILILSNNK